MASLSTPSVRSARAQALCRGAIDRRIDGYIYVF
jgi:hypothetical protein